MKKLEQTLKITLVLTFWTGASWGQQPGSQAGPETTAHEAPAITPLSGAEEFTPSAGGGGHSYFLPAFQWTGYADTLGTRRGGGLSHLETRSVYIASFTLQRVRKHSQTNLDYAGAGFLYSRPVNLGNGLPPSSYGTFQQLGWIQSFSARRWKAMLGDEGSYLPESAFGFSGFGGLGSFGLGQGGAFYGTGIGLNSSLIPNQTILTGYGRRLSNLALTQVEYDPGARSAISAAVSYGTLRFLDGGFLPSDSLSVFAGYNFALTPRDTIEVGYVHFYFRFHGQNRQILNRGLQLSYGHRITGRLSLELSAGAVANDVAKPLGGSVTKSFITTYDSLQYLFRRGNMRLSYLRYVSNGAGLFLGAETDLVQLSAGRQFWRSFFGSLNAGHAYNQSLTQQSSATPRSKFETWQAGASVSRQFGQHISAYLNYYVQRQISSTPLCFTNNCATFSLRQTGGVGINWHGRPIRLR